MADGRRPLLRGMRDDFRGLLKAPKDLWIVYATKLIESVAYFAIVNVLILYLHDDLRFSDEASGSIVGTWYTLISLLVFVSGFIADAMGKKKALIIAALSLIVGRALLTFSEIRAVPLLGLLAGCWGLATMKPVMVAVVKSYAPAEIRSFAYSIYYVVMNLGAFFAGRLVSWLRIGLLGRQVRPFELFSDVPVAPESERAAVLDELMRRMGKADFGERAVEAMRAFARFATGRDYEFWTRADLDAIRAASEAYVAGRPIANPPVGLSGYEMIFLVATALSLISLVLVRMLRADEPASEPTPGRSEAAPRAAATGGIGQVLKKALSIGDELRKEKNFWAFVLFVGLLVLVRAVFVHAHLTWPTYMLREFGRETPQAAIWSFNPLLIIVLTPFVGSATSRFSAWWVIIIGSFITAASILFMVSHEPSEALARRLLSPVFGAQLHYEYAGAYLFVFTLSVGEALWSPRLYEYIAMMAPQGRESSYMGLAELPMFLAKTPVGFAGGFLTATYCAENAPCQSEPIWLIIFASTLAGPVIALLFSGFIRAAEREKLAADREAAARA